MDFIEREEFMMNVRGLAIKFKFSEIEKVAGKVKGQLTGYVEIKENKYETPTPKDDEDDEPVQQTPIKAKQGFFDLWNKSWTRRYYELQGTQLSIFEIKSTSGHHQVKVLIEIIELTEYSYPREMLLDRDKHGVCDNKPRVLSLITVQDPEDQATHKKLTCSDCQQPHQLDILIHCETQENYDSLFKALKKIRKYFDDTKNVYIGDPEARREYLKCIEVIK